MKVGQITQIIDTYRFYKTKIHQEKSALQWELLSTGETEKSEQLQKQIKADEDSLGKFLDEEV